MNIDNFTDEELLNASKSKRKEETISKEDSLWQDLRFKESISHMCNGTLSAEDEKYLVDCLNEHFGWTSCIDPNKSHSNPYCKPLNPLIAEFSEIIKDEVTQAKLEQISLWVVSEPNMPYRNSKPDCSFNKTNFPTEYYGYYDSYNDAIVLCPERIMQAPLELEKQNRHITSRELYVVVLVHALAHALMDPTRYDKKHIGSYQPLINIKNGFSEREVLMEESLANMITLQYFDVARQKGIIDKTNAYEREFIGAQNLEYSFGLDQFDLLKPDWCPWREYKAKLPKFIKK